MSRFMPLALVLTAALTQACVAPSDSASPDPVTAPGNIDLSSYVFKYYPQGGVNLAYCPAPTHAPVDTTFKLKYASVYLGDPSNTYTAYRDVTADVVQQSTDSKSDNVSLKVNAAGGLSPSLEFSTDSFSKTELESAYLELEFSVTLPISVDPSQKSFNYWMWLSPNQGSWVFKATDPMSLFPNPGDCKEAYPIQTPPNHVTITTRLSDGFLTSSNAFCGSDYIAQAWPQGAALQFTGPAIAKTTGSQKISLVEFTSVSPVTIQKNGHYQFSIDLKSSAEIPDPRQVTGLTLSAQFTGVPSLAGKTFLLDAGSPQLNLYYGSGGTDKSQLYAELTFEDTITLPISSPADLCPGSVCLDGSAVINCPLYNCQDDNGPHPGQGSGVIVPQPIGYKVSCASACKSMYAPGKFEAPLCGSNEPGPGDGGDNGG